MRVEDINEARLRKDRRRQVGREYFNIYYRIRKSKTKLEDIILIYNINLID